MPEEEKGAETALEEAVENLGVEEDIEADPDDGSTDDALAAILAEVTGDPDPDAQSGEEEGESGEAEGRTPQETHFAKVAAEKDLVIQEQKQKLDELETDRRVRSALDDRLRALTGTKKTEEPTIDFVGDEIDFAKFARPEGHAQRAW